MFLALVLRPILVPRPVPWCRVWNPGLVTVHWRASKAEHNTENYRPLIQSPASLCANTQTVAIYTCYTYRRSPKEEGSKSGLVDARDLPPSGRKRDGICVNAVHKVLVVSEWRDRACLWREVRKEDSHRPGASTYRVDLPGAPDAKLPNNDRD
ncbi:hypothetical protein BaRGS_00023427 [Batillaria attramentaria]|uniref:Secreted protein n=1 Tax=Batillaria attramentaria TaxID=370345 RepID=A0ABD0KE11_9CAEN